jgi:hypothetical protein
MMQVYEEVEKHIASHGYDVQCFGYDPYNAKDFVERWIRENGPFGVEKVIQGSRTESVPLGELKKLAEEREAEAKAEADRVQKEELENLKKELNHNKAVNAYKAITDDSMIETLIDAVSDADHNAIANILEKYASAKVKEAQAEWQKSRPRVNMGGEGSITKEQFNAMSMAEKSKLYRENKAEYDRLNS